MFKQIREMFPKKVYLLVLVILLFELLFLSGCTQQKQTAPPENNSPADIQPAPGPDSTPQTAPELEPPSTEIPPVQEPDKNTDAPIVPSLIVSRVIDGDTILLNSGETVRLICIDTPETDEPGFQDAKNYLTGLVLNKNIRLVKDVSETDRYDRLLRYMYLGDLFVNGAIVKAGYAEAYRYPPDIALCNEIEALEATAKAQKIGIWAQTPSSPTGPTSPTQYVCSSNHYNCSDFTTQAQAQAAYNACKPGDIHQLDADDDGEACESLP